MRKTMICLSIGSHIASHSRWPVRQNPAKKRVKKVDPGITMAELPKDELLVWLAFLFCGLWTSYGTQLCWQVMPCPVREH